ncbi:MAG: hypothetical protein M3067_11645 [Chloroflexota bacterium]|nr:hypothetical protein [Chloroflexota bacterium]
MSFQWSVPDGWGDETIQFPLPFAPDLPYRGTEELRFMPGWAKPGAADHWSYVFAWWLEGSMPPEEAAITADLASYYAGLCAAVAGESAVADPDGHRVGLRRVGAAVRAGHQVQRFDGTADLVDAFAGGEAMTLNLRLETWACPIASHVAVLIAASRTLDEATWERLLAQAGEFACH